MIRVVDWFSGVGGFSLGLEWAGGFETVAFCETDPYACRVLEKHWPGVKNLGDIREIRPSDIPTAELWTGGFPCQPFSVAGKRAGTADDRDLWPVWADLIGTIRPRFLLAENVPGLLTGDGGRWFGRCVRDLASFGYVVEWAVVGAHEVGAPHRRDRLWIWASLGNAELPSEDTHAARCRPRDTADARSRPELGGQDDQIPARRDAAGRGDSELAHTPGERLEGRRHGRGGIEAERVGLLPPGPDQRITWPPGWAIDPADVAESALERIDGGGESRPGRRGEPTDCGFCGADQGPAAPLLGRVAHGIPDRTHRLRCLGNAVVPQVVQWIGQRLKDSGALG